MTPEREQKLNILLNQILTVGRNADGNDYYLALGMATGAYLQRSSDPNEALKNYIVFLEYTITVKSMTPQ